MPACGLRLGMYLVRLKEEVNPMTKKPIKAAFFDFDGTLFSHTIHNIPESAVKALNKLKDNGVLLFLATGRHPETVKEMLKDRIEFDGGVFLNGQMGMLSDYSMLFGNPISEKATEKIIEYFKEKKYPITLLEEDDIYTNFVNDYVKNSLLSVSSPLTNVHEYSGKPIYQAIVYGGADHQQQIREAIPDVHVTAWNPYAADIISRGSGKAAGISRMLEHFGLVPEEIIAFGDGQNDMDMLALAGTSVAMGNAVDELKENADYTAKSIDQDGVEKMLEELQLID